MSREEQCWHRHRAVPPIAGGEAFHACPDAAPAPAADIRGGAAAAATIAAIAAASSAASDAATRAAASSTAASAAAAWARRRAAAAAAASASGPIAAAGAAGRAPAAHSGRRGWPRHMMAHTQGRCERSRALPQHPTQAGKVAGSWR